MTTDEPPSPPPDASPQGRPPEALVRALAAVLPADRVLARPIDVIAHAADASFYRLVPKVVVRPESVDEIGAILGVSRTLGVPLTFRAAGTSLSGQAITDGILVDAARRWKRIEILDGGRRVRVEPGVIGADVNRALARYGRRIGPDPASIDHCMIGGIIANNASGMCCGVSENAYHTVACMRFVLPGGVVVDSARPDADERLRAEAGALHARVLALRDRVRADDELCRRIRAKYRQKNTTGYALNAFLDYDRAVEILTRLMIGSEGTLGFIAEAVFDTLPAYPHKRAALCLFADLRAAAEAAARVAASGARAIELMDRACLRAAASQPGLPDGVADLPEDAAALLIEYQGADEDELAALRARGDAVLAELPLALPARFTEDERERAALWRLRKGLLPTVGATKASGETVVIEDVAFPLERLAGAVLDLQRLFRDHGYQSALLFGHAKDGNCHFVLTQSFNRPEEIERYRRFIEALVELVTGRYDGALKAEHGTGRNMAPFVEAEWGREAVAIMRELKAAVDPRGLLNPGVIVTDDARAHVRHLKDLPAIEEEADRCIECGFCERVCPSRGLTATPRQRIVVRRELARRARGTHPDDARVAASLRRDYAYTGLATCAADGLCARACPVAIDTGALVKRLRGEAASPRVQRAASWLAGRYGLLERALRLGIGVGHVGARIFGHRFLRSLTRALGWLARRRVPQWSRAIPRLAPARLPASGAEREASAEIVYVPSCLSRVMGLPPGAAPGAAPSLLELIATLAERAGTSLWIPSDCRGQCCGLPFGSKGLHQAQHVSLVRLIDGMWGWSRGGARPLVMDASSCLHTLRQASSRLGERERERLARMTVLDPVELAHAWVIAADTSVPGRLVAREVDRRVVLHPSCATRKLGLDDALVAVTRCCARVVDVPATLECCATAGDRGLMYPELARAALAAEAREVAAGGYDGHFSTNLTCEVGLTEAIGHDYRSFLYLVEEATRPPSA